MSDDPTGPVEDNESSGSVPDLVLELNFVPEWARRPPDQKHYGDHHADYTERPQRGRGGRRPGPPRGGRDGRRDRPPRGPRDDRRPGEGAPRGRGDAGQGDRGPYPPRAEPGGARGGPGGARGEPRDRSEPRGARGERPSGPRSREPVVQAPPGLSVRVLPEQKQLSSAARQLHSAKRSYPLAQIASLFLSKDSACYVRIECDRASPTPAVYQCKDCQSVFLDRESIFSHVTSEHLSDHFEKEEIEVEEPKGSFVCVARCTLSGTLLGPPNHHSYNERVRELHAERFSHMAFEDYQRRIEMVHDPDMVEQWKKASTRKTVYRRKGEEPGTGEPMKWADVEEFFAGQIAPDLVHETRKVVLPAGVARGLRDRALSPVVKDLLRQDGRAPRSLLFAIRAALRHKHLHLFRAGGRMEFVTAIRPRPLDPAVAIEPIREVLTHLHEHPGCTRELLLESLRPGCSPDSPEASEVISPLGWLIDRGHIIEFFDGSLSVPLHSGR